MDAHVTRESVSLVGRDLHHKFGQVEVLRSVSLTLHRGEWIALTGPSGSGKTTLLSILGGLLEPTAGTVGIVDPARESQTRIRDAAAWVLQTTTALGSRSVLDNGALGGLSTGLAGSQAATIAKEILITVGLGERLSHRARALSSGELQRLSIARALTSLRPFLFADEPTGHLDRRTSDRVIEYMTAACRDVGVVIATHDPSVANRCDRILELRNGDLVDG